jgi:hypothetical protein
MPFHAGMQLLKTDYAVAFNYIAISTQLARTVRGVAA